MVQRRYGQSGLTLLEVILAVSLMVVLMGSVHVFFSSSLATTQHGEGLCRQARLARAALERIADDVRSVNGQLELSDSVLVGDAHSITMYTTRLPGPELFAEPGITEAPIAVSSDVSKVQYYIAIDPEEFVETEDGEEQAVHYGLVRWEQTLLNQAVPLLAIDGQKQKAEIELWADEIVYLGFRYFDGVEWVMTWEGGAGNSLPQAVKIVVGFTPASEEELEAEEIALESESVGEPAELEEHAYDDRYSVVVFLSQADVMMTSRLLRAKQVGQNLRAAE